MDRSYRQSMLQTIHPRASANSILRELTREYTLDEVAIVTRAAPARILGLAGRGTLTSGAVADLAAYQPRDNWQATFERAVWVMKDGISVVRDGQSLQHVPRCQTLTSRTSYDRSAWLRFASEVEQTLSVPWQNLVISEQELADRIRRPHAALSGHPTLSAAYGDHGRVTDAD